ncbi:MAG TPA: DNA polymerase III subunit chi [Gammaproteobacteria bacterium]|nr:DNA polymerase III subunit chi [Gammaproteobacteria bacterium]
MTQVDFYILNKTQPEQFSCLLVEKILKQGHKVHILTSDNQQSERMDNLMWTYNDQSFLPHVLMDDPLQAETPINISHNPETALISDVLVNLTPKVPLFYKQFERVAELVSSNPQQRQAARGRYREYQQQGCTVVSHEINR